MGNLEQKSTFNGRKIRIEGQESLSNVQETVNEGDVLLSEAASKGMLKTGMIVTFKDCVSSEIKLEREMAGKEQTFQCELSKGVVFQKVDGRYAILAIMKCNPCIEFGGRYARANSKDAVDYVVNTALIKNACALKLQDFVENCAANYLITSYVFDDSISVNKIIFGADVNEGLDYIEGLAFGYHRFYVERRFAEFNAIAICLELDKMYGNIKENLGSQSTLGYSYSMNPFEYHIEIGEIMK